MTAGKARNKKAPAPVAPSKKRTSASTGARRELARKEAELREQLRASQPLVQRLDEQLRALLPTPEQQRLLARAGKFTKQLQRDFEVAKQQGQELLKLGGLPWQEAVAFCAANPPDATAIVWLIQEVRRTAIAEANSKNAQGRNAAARTIVCKAWDDRTDIGQSATSFGREWAARLRVDYGITVTPPTISARWLKGR
jgi:hypothetical protein